MLPRKKSAVCRDCPTLIPSNKSYCDPCRIERKRKAGVAYYYKKIGRPMPNNKECRVCHCEIPSNRVYCVPCADDSRRKVVARSQAKTRGFVKKVTTINPRWLTRGTPTYGNRSCMISNEY